MNTPEGFDIRYSEEQDLMFLERWFSDPLTCNDFPFGFDEQADALKNWIGFHRFQASLTGTVNGTVCAIGTLFLMPYRKVAHHCSFYLIVDPIYRNQGIGTSMVRNLINLAKVKFHLESIHVELYAPNRLSSILEKLGFELFVEQKNYLKIDGQGHSRLLFHRFTSGDSIRG